MYSKLVFTTDTETIEFDLHEVVWIAQELLTTVNTEKTVIPSAGMYEQIIMAVTNGISDQRVINGDIDQFLFIPMLISGINTIGKWLYIAKELSKRPETETMKGWWANIGHRLILIKNAQRQLFYITDHGHFKDIIEYFNAAVFQLPWIEDPLFIESLKKNLDIYNQLPPDEQRKFKDEFNKKHSNNWSIDDIHRAFAYLKDRILPSFYKLFGVHSLLYNIILVKKHGNDQNTINQLVRRIVLADIAKNTNEGDAKYIVRPLRAYGSENEGGSYRAFTESLTRYFSQPFALTPPQLATKMRSLLIGKPLDAASEDNIDFLVNLTGAWFIAEAARNPVSILSGLILLDMIENEITLKDGENNLYSWRHVLIHPQKPADSRTPVTIKNLYGDDIELAKFDGSHPMAHAESVNDSKKKLSKGEKLSAVRQKEGSLILHWLYEKLSTRNSSLKVALKTAKESPLAYEKGRVPSYHEIDVLLAAKGKPTKSIKGDSRLLKKWEILHTLIIPCLNERLSTLGNLLSVQPAKKLAALFQQWDSHKSENSATDILKLFNKEAPLQSIDTNNATENNALNNTDGQQRKLALANRAACAGYNCHDVAQDGNCFFHAVADQLNRIGRTGQDIDPDILRMVAAAEINDHFERYQDFISEQQRQNYANHISQSKVWVGMIVAHAIARIKNVIIVIIPSDGGMPQVIKSAGAKDVIVLGNEVGIHFQSLVPKCGMPGKASDLIQKIIDATPELDNGSKELERRTLHNNPATLFYQKAWNNYLGANPRLQHEHDKSRGLILSSDFETQRYKTPR